MPVDIKDAQIRLYMDAIAQKEEHLEVFQALVDLARDMFDHKGPISRELAPNYISFRIAARTTDDSPLEVYEIAIMRPARDGTTKNPIEMVEALRRELELANDTVVAASSRVLALQDQLRQVRESAGTA